MNAIATKTDLVPAINEDEAVRVLQSSLYPGARVESIKLVLAWCRATGRDPMKKPIHIVPMRVRDQQSGRYEWRDVLMPGIGTYRSDASKTGTYVGQTEPEFGPDKRSDVDGCELTYPEWCKVTVKRIVAGQIGSWTAKELWLENYASGEGGKGVNAMWRKRPYGQLAKVAESQALRKAFPDETGNTYTSEEMEGKHFEGTTIEAEQPVKPPAKAAHKTIKSERYEEMAETEAHDVPPQDLAFIERAEQALMSEKNRDNKTRWLKLLGRILSQSPTLDDVAAIRGVPSVSMAEKTWTPMLRTQIADLFTDAAARLRADWDPTNGNGEHPMAPEELRKAAESGAFSDGQEVKTVVEALKAEPNDDPEEAFEPGDPL